jgi:putative oxidoreductase
LLFGRLVTVVGLLPNGLRKIATFDQTAAGMGGVPQIINGRPFPDQAPLVTFPIPELFLGFSVAFDLAGAVLIILGWQTRIVGALLAGYVLIAMTIFHSDVRHSMDVMQIIRNLPMLGGLVMLGGIGGGWWSLDGLFSRAPLSRRADA